MKKDFVYFFKHNNVGGIKIGKTSGESVLDRFNSFKTFSPFGASIIGFFETDNGFKDEKELHQRFKDFRMQGEFFDISIDLVNNIIFEKNKDYHKTLNIFNEWIANNENDIDKLNNLFKKVKEVNFDNGLISNDIYNYIENNKYELDKWYNFNDEYQLLNKKFDVSTISFTKNLNFYCINNNYKLEKIRKRSDNNRFYYKIVQLAQF
jgi:hypothetical protein